MADNPPPNPEKVSTGSGANSDSTVDSSEYELVAPGSESTSPPVGGEAGDAATVKKQLEESMKEEENETNETRLNLTNENVDDDDDEGVRFDSIVFLGRFPIADPKNETSIHDQIREHNVLHDLDSNSGQYKTVKVQVKKFAYHIHHPGLSY